MSTGWITAVGPWHWVLVAIVLIILEVFSPAAFFLWLAVLPELDWQIQLVLFGVFSILSLILGRRYLKATGG